MELNLLIKLYFLLIMADFVTGVIAAGYEGRLKSKTMSKGLWTTFAELVLLMVLYAGFSLVPNLSDVGNFFVMGMVVKELISINENLARANVKIPQWSKDWLEIYDKENDKIKPR